MSTSIEQKDCNEFKVKDLQLDAYGQHESRRVPQDGSWFNPNPSTLNEIVAEEACQKSVFDQ